MTAGLAFEKTAMTCAACGSEVVVLMRTKGGEIWLRCSRDRRLTPDYKADAKSKKRKVGQTECHWYRQSVQVPADYPIDKPHVFNFSGEMDDV